MSASISTTPTKASKPTDSNRGKPLGVGWCVAPEWILQLSVFLLRMLSPRWLFYVSARRSNLTRYRPRSRLTYWNVHTALLVTRASHLDASVVILAFQSNDNFPPILGRAPCLSDACRLPRSMPVSSKSWLVEISISRPAKLINEYSEIASPNILPYNAPS